MALVPVVTRSPLVLVTPVESTSQRDSLPCEDGGKGAQALCVPPVSVDCMGQLGQATVPRCQMFAQHRYRCFRGGIFQMG